MNPSPARWIKELALPQLQARWHLQLGSNPWPRTPYAAGGQKKSPREPQLSATSPPLPVPLLCSPDSHQRLPHPQTWGIFSLPCRLPRKHVPRSGLHPPQVTFLPPHPPWEAGLPSELQNPLLWIPASFSIASCKSQFQYLLCI